MYTYICMYRYIYWCIYQLQIIASNLKKEKYDNASYDCLEYTEYILTLVLRWAPSTWVRTSSEDLGWTRVYVLKSGNKSKIVRENQQRFPATATATSIASLFTLSHFKLVLYRTLAPFRITLVRVSSRPLAKLLHCTQAHPRPRTCQHTTIGTLISCLLF